MSLSSGKAATRGRLAPARLVRAVSSLPLGLDARLLWLTSITGALAGLLAVAYFYALSFALAAIGRAEERLPVFWLMPAAGLLIGLAYRLGSPGDTDAVVDNIHLKKGRIDTGANLPLMPISLLSIAAGGSAGPEAPMVYLTGSVATWLRRFIDLPEEDIRTLTLTGMAVGFATLFGAPIGAALFALEIPHRRGLEYYEATVPSIVGCLVGYGIFSGLTHHGIGAAWTFAPYRFGGPSDLVLAGVIGLFIGLCSFPFVWSLRSFKALFLKLRLPMPIKAAIGGLILGLLAYQLPATRFWGEEQLQRAIVDASPTVTLLLILAAAKVIAVSITLAAGWRGGIIIPCFFIGACLGKATSLWFPSIDPTLAMICGMTALNVAVMKVPLATILVVATMTGIDAVPPIAAASFVAFLVSGGVNFIEAKRERSSSSGEAGQVRGEGERLNPAVVV